MEDGCGIIDSSLVPPRQCFFFERSLDASNVSNASNASNASDAWLTQLHLDIEVLEPRDDHQASLLSLVDRTTLKGSRTYLASLLGSVPVSDPLKLRARQQALEDLEKKGLIADKDGERKMTALEPDVLWFFRQKEDDTLSFLTDSVYFDSWPLSILNSRSPLALSGMHAYNAWSPWVSILSPVIYLAIPYLVLRWKGIVNFGFLRYLWLMAKSTVSEALCLGQEGISVFTRVGSALRGLSGLLSTGVFFYSIVNSFKLSQTFEKVGRTVTDRIEGALEYLAISRKRKERFFGSDDSIMGLWWAWPKKAASCSFRNAKKDRGFYLKRGEQLVDAKRFDHDEAVFDLSMSYAIDSLASILKSRKALGFCWAEYSNDELPFIDLTGVRHPFLPKEVAVENDWSLGTSSSPNALLTGPNAGGKSTLMKAVLSTVLLAQTLTIAPCESCKLTPFSTIASHLSAVDRAGSASTFETEMLRAQKVLEHLSDESKMLVVIDEIFSSTNPVEGIAAASAVTRRLGRSKSTLSIVSTHFVHLGKLAGERFAKFQMPVSRSAAITYPYKLCKGVCRQLIALELMKKSGFDALVVDEALEIARTFSRGVVAS